MKLITKGGSLTIEEAEHLISKKYSKKAMLISDIEAHNQPMLGEVGSIPRLNEEGEENTFFYEYWKKGAETILFRHLAPYKPKADLARLTVNVKKMAKKVDEDIKDVKEYING